MRLLLGQFPVQDRLTGPGHVLDRQVDQAFSGSFDAVDQLAAGTIDGGSQDLVAGSVGIPASGRFTGGENGHAGDASSGGQIMVPVSLPT